LAFAAPVVFAGNSALKIEANARNRCCSVGIKPWSDRALWRTLPEEEFEKVADLLYV
jgi:hypothetical protein